MAEETRATDPTETQLRTFLIADMRGFTAFSELNGDAAAAALAEQFARTVEIAVSECGGRVVELRGDEALAAFSSARAAVRAAVEVQAACRRPGVAALPLAVGIGLDAGEAVAVGEGFRARALNLAARLCSGAIGGEILATETVCRLAGPVEEARYSAPLQRRLKGMAEPVAVRRVEPTRVLPLPPARPRLPRRRRREVWIPALIAGGVLIAGAAALAWATTDSGYKGAGPPAVSLRGVNLATGTSTNPIPLPADAAAGGTIFRGVVANAKTLWVLGQSGVSRVDPATGKVTKIPIPGGARNMAFGGGSGFVSGTAADQTGVYQIDLSDPPTVEGFSPLPAPTRLGDNTSKPAPMVTAGGSVWLPAYDGVWRLDETNFQHPQRTRMPIGGHFSIAAGAGAVWVVTDAGDIDRIDPQTGAVTARAVQLRGGRLAREVAFAQGALWILSVTTTAALVTEVNPGNGHTILTRRFSGAEYAGLTGGQQALLSYTDTHSARYIVQAIGPTGTIIRTVRSRSQIVGATVDQGAIWIVTVGH